MFRTRDAFHDRLARWRYDHRANLAVYINFIQMRMQ
jgi:hypothetical protein